MKKIWIALVLCCFAHTCFAADLLIFSGAGLMKPMEEFRQNFEQQHQVKLNIHYGGSGELFGKLATGQPCDLLIPGAEKHTYDALKNGWIQEETIKKLVHHVPIIIVPKDNPADIHGVKDLAKPGVRVAIGDPKSPAIGKVAQKIFKKSGIFEQIQPNIKVLAPTVNQLLVYVVLEQVDASIIWEDMLSWAEGQGKVITVPIEPEYNEIKTIPTAVTSAAPHPELAVKFNDYISSDEGMEIWQKWGFEPCGE